MIEKYFNICKVHWKEIVALSIVWHFVFDLFIFGFGVMLGMHIGH